MYIMITLWDRSRNRICGEIVGKLVKTEHKADGVWFKAVPKMPKNTPRLERRHFPTVGNAAIEHKRTQFSSKRNSARSVVSQLVAIYKFIEGLASFRC